MGYRILFRFARFFYTILSKKQRRIHSPLFCWLKYPKGTAKRLKANKGNNFSISVERYKESFFCVWIQCHISNYLVWVSHRKLITKKTFCSICNISCTFWCEYHNKYSLIDNILENQIKLKVIGHSELTFKAPNVRKRKMSKYIHRIIEMWVDVKKKWPMGLVCFCNWILKSTFSANECKI